jgi:hypothetical protein
MNNTMTEMKPEEVERTFFDTFNASGPEAAAEYLDQDYTSEVAPLSSAV